MRLPSHNSRDRITVSKLSGTSSRHASHLHQQPDRAVAVAEAVAELRSISTDKHLIAHATVGTRSHGYELRRELLLAAGADPAVLELEAAEVDRRIEGGTMLSRLAEGTNRLGSWHTRA